MADVDLDDPNVLARCDPSGMAELIEGSPGQVGAAWRAGSEWLLPESLRAPSRVVVAGIGGSAIGADVIATLALERSAVPVQVVRGYRIPPLDDGTLLVGCSFSGNTAETCAALAESVGEPGMRLVCTTGGVLAALAEVHAWPMFRYAIPGPPRSALAWSAFSLLAVLARVGAIPVEEGEIAALELALRRASSGLTPAVSGEANLAKRLAGPLAGQAVLVLGAGPLEVAARRWASQLNENAKQWAVSMGLPEASHNLIVPFSEPRHPGAAALPFVVILDAPALDERMSGQVALTAITLEAAGVRHEVVRMASTSPLGALMEACLLGDWVSLYAAALNEVDPMPVDALDRFKVRLANATAI